MTTFRDMVNSDARNVLLQDFGEAQRVTYYALGQEWDGRQVDAHVSRQMIRPSEFGDTHVNVLEAEVRVRVEDIPEVKKGRDKIGVPKFAGGVAEIARVTEVQPAYSVGGEPAGLWKLTVQW